MISKIKRKISQTRHAAQQRARRSHDDHHAHELNCASLCCARNGQSGCILKLIGEAGEAARLRDLGLCEGARVTVLREGDPLVVRVEDARFGIGRAAAMNVLCTLDADGRGS